MIQSVKTRTVKTICKPAVKAICTTDCQNNLYGRFSERSVRLTVKKHSLSFTDPYLFSRTAAGSGP